MTTPSREDLGTYFSVYRALFSDPKYQRLNSAERSTYIALKRCMSGIAGIDCFAPGELEAKLVYFTALSEADVRAAVGKLEADGWMKRDGSVVEVVGHLDEDPHAHVEDRKKRKNVQRHVASLSPNGLVASYVERHPEWFPATEWSGGSPRFGEARKPSITLPRLLEESSRSLRTTSTVTETVTATETDTPTLSREGFDSLWATYPRRSGSNPRDKAEAEVKARLTEGVSFETLKEKTRAYAEWAAATRKTGTQYVKTAARFYGPDREYEDDWTVPPEMPGAGQSTPRIGSDSPPMAPTRVVW